MASCAKATRHIPWHRGLSAPVYHTYSVIPLHHESNTSVRVFLLGLKGRISYRSLTPTSTPEPDKGCAVSKDGNLLDASKIAFYNSPSDEHPLQVPEPVSLKPSSTAPISTIPERPRRAKQAKFMAALLAEKESISGDEQSEEQRSTVKTSKEKSRSGPKIKFKLSSSSAEKSIPPSATNPQELANDPNVPKQRDNSKKVASGEATDTTAQVLVETLSADVEIIEVGAKHAGEKVSLNQIYS